MVSFEKFLALIDDLNLKKRFLFNLDLFIMRVKFWNERVSFGKLKVFFGGEVTF